MADKQPQDVKRDIQEQRRKLKAAEPQFQRPLIVVHIPSGLVIEDHTTELFGRWRP